MEKLESILTDLSEIEDSILIDKNHWLNRFLKHYDELFFKTKYDVKALLEIGVGKQGGSVKLWERYFPNAEIFAWDIDEDLLKFSTNRIHIDIVNQENVVEIKRWLSKNPQKLNIVIDDGGHRMKQQIISFQQLWPFVEWGGYYIIEDTLTSYIDKYQDGSITCIDFFKKMIDELHFNGQYPDSKLKHWKKRRKNLTPVQDTVEYINFYRNLLVIKKRDYSLSKEPDGI